MTAARLHYWVAIVRPAHDIHAKGDLHINATADFALPARLWGVSNS